MGASSQVVMNALMILPLPNEVHPRNDRLRFSSRLFCLILDKQKWQLKRVPASDVTPRSVQLPKAPADR